MINLKPYKKKKSADFLQEIIDKKSTTKADPEYHSRLVLVKPWILDQYVIFDQYFISNSLEKISAFGFKDKQLADLLKLYSYKNKFVQALKVDVTTTASNRKIGTCQNCTISEVNSMDHILPKIDYAEFSVHPSNLFPSCTICNSYKSTIWEKDGTRFFLNLYLDILPPQQYVFVKIIDGGNTPRAEFYLDNRNSIDKDIFRLINSHYDGLHLCERFSQNIDLVVTPLKNAIKSFIGDLSIDRIKSINLERIKKDLDSFGSNYWKSILEAALLNDKDFISSIQKNTP